MSGAGLRLEPGDQRSDQTAPLPPGTDHTHDAPLWPGQAPWSCAGDKGCWTRRSCRVWPPGALLPPPWSPRPGRCTEGCDWLRNNLTEDEIEAVWRPGPRPLGTIPSASEFPGSASFGDRGGRSQCPPGPRCWWWPPPGLRSSPGTPGKVRTPPAWEVAATPPSCPETDLNGQFSVWPR